jgi:hypothetical protein
MRVLTIREAPLKARPMTDRKAHLAYLAHTGPVNANNTHFSWFHLAMEEIR